MLRSRQETDFFHDFVKRTLRDARCKLGAVSHTFFKIFFIFHYLVIAFLYRLELSYDGFTVTAVRPADAAPMLLRAGLTLSADGDAAALGLPAALAVRGDARCAYFSDDMAAYSVYAPAADAETFAQLLSRLEWTD